MRLVKLIIFVAVLNSCVENKKIIRYDMSSSGAINSIKEINGEIYVLNSTNSSILKLSGGRTELFRDLEVKGRDFLLDFDIEGQTVYYSNTYDEIFKADRNAIEDTIKVMDPDRIEVAGDRIFITTRKAEEGYFYIISVDKLKGKVIAKRALNDSFVTGGVFSTASISASKKGLWLINTFRNRLELYVNDLQLSQTHKLDNSYQYGNFRINQNQADILCSKNGSVFACKFDLISGEYKYSEMKCEPGSFDLSVSAVSEGGIYIYDYIQGIIRILR